MDEDGILKYEDYMIERDREAIEPQPTLQGVEDGFRERLTELPEELREHLPQDEPIDK